jgi:hypothetical protein
MGLRARIFTRQRQAFNGAKGVEQNSSQPKMTKLFVCAVSTRTIHATMIERFMGV